MIFRNLSVFFYTYQQKIKQAHHAPQKNNTDVPQQ